MNKNRVLTESAILTAISVVLVVLAGIIPPMSTAFVAAAGLMPTVIVIRYKTHFGFFVFVSSALLSVLIAPDKGAALMYTLFFGHYPMMKSYIEKLRNIVLEWLLKLTLANALFVAFYFIVTAFFPAMVDFERFYKLLVLLLANAAFVIYDIGFTKLLIYFERRIRKI